MHLVGDAILNLIVHVISSIVVRTLNPDQGANLVLGS